MKKNFKTLSRADRYDLKVLGKISLDSEDGKGESYICNTINISLSGALVETGSQIPVGSLLKYSFSIPGFQIPVNIIGEVVRGENTGGLPEKSGKSRRSLNRYGIIFLDLSEEDKKAMIDFFLANKQEAGGKDEGEED
jgi:PilZ domain-containing protein